MRSNDVVLVPAFHHGSEIEALLKADLKIRYYELTETLEPEPNNLQSLLSPEVIALHLIHYWGFPQDAERWRHWCDDRGLLLIEDAAQAFQATQDGRPVGSFGHMAVFCLYKTYGIPDGGALISVAPPAPTSTSTQTGLWRLIKRHFNWVAERSAVIGSMHLLISPYVKWWRKRRSLPNEEFELHDPSTPASAITTGLLTRIVAKETAERRRKNYKFLFNHLSELVPVAFALLADGACPLVFPIEVNDPKAFLKKLSRHGVVGGRLWPTPHPSLPVADFPGSRALRERLVGLPVHQELTLSELQQIVDAVHQSLIRQSMRVPQPG
jgi:dTDP-4-amino-4,6-dideoxygalactose transaminase